MFLPYHLEEYIMCCDKQHGNHLEFSSKIALPRRSETKPKPNLFIDKKTKCFET